MDFGFTGEQQKLRKEIHDFYANELPEDFEDGWGVSEEVQAFFRQLQKKAGKKGYLTPGWSKEVGGLGLGSIEQGIVNEEVANWGIEWPNHIGSRQAGPATLIFGTEGQKKRFLTPITQGDVIWFQAFTEPDAGTDEANIQCRAVQDSDDFIVNGQKIFITGNYKPDYLFTEVRTADIVPKHRGLSLFLVPANLPGITFRPLPTMGFALQNEIFFDDVRIPKEYLLGQLNRGFYHAMETFAFERSGTGAPGHARHMLLDFIEFCKEETRNGKPLFDDPKVQDELAQMVVELEVWRLIAWHAQWWGGNREKLGPKPFDLSGHFNKTVSTHHAQTMMDILGYFGQLREGSEGVKFAGRVERRWQKARSLHGGGTIEMYKIVLAQRGLGLPRAGRQAATRSEEKREVK